MLKTYPCQPPAPLPEGEGRYVGIPDEEDDGIPFEEKMEALTQELAEQMRQGLALDQEIKIQLGKVGFSLEEF